MSRKITGADLEMVLLRAPTLSTRLRLTAGLSPSDRNDLYKLSHTGSELQYKVLGFEIVGDLVVTMSDTDWPLVQPRRDRGSFDKDLT